MAGNRGTTIHVEVAQFFPRLLTRESDVGDDENMFLHEKMKIELLQKQLD